MYSVSLNLGTVRAGLRTRPFSLARRRGGSVHADAELQPPEVYTSNSDSLTPYGGNARNPISSTAALLLVLMYTASKRRLNKQVAA